MRRSWQHLKSSLRLTSSFCPLVKDILPPFACVPVTMEPFTTSLHGLEIGIRPGYSLPPAEGVQLYANKPLPPLPPPRIQQRRIPRKPVASGDARRKHIPKRPLHRPNFEGRALPYRDARLPSSDDKWQAVTPKRSRASSHGSIIQKSPRHGVDRLEEYPGRFSGSTLPSVTQFWGPTRKDSQSYDPTLSKSDHRSQMLDSSPVPSLEPDIDGMSSKKSSWGPLPPHTNSHATKTTTRLSNEFILPKIVFEDDLASRWDDRFDLPACSRTPSQHHKSANDGALLHEYTSIDGNAVRMPILKSPPSLSSRFSLFTTDQLSRREPPRLTKSSSGHISHPARSPYPEQAFFSSQTHLAPFSRSAFDSDSDEKEDDDQEDDVNARHGIKNLFSVKSINRSSSMDLLSPRSRRQSDPPKLAKHFSGLLSETRERWQSFRLDRRREGMRKQIKMLPGAE